MTVFVYVNITSRLATPSTSRCSPTRMPPRSSSRRMIPRAWRSSKRFWKESRRRLISAYLRSSFRKSYSQWFSRSTCDFSIFASRLREVTTSRASLLLDMDDPPLSANYLSAISYASHGHGDQRVDLRCHPRAPCLAGGSAIGLSATAAWLRAVAVMGRQ
jgi:hypothetical protein